VNFLDYFNTVPETLLITVPAPVLAPVPTEPNYGSAKIYGSGSATLAKTESSKKLEKVH